MSVFIMPAGTLRLPWLRFFRAFSSVVRQMPGYNSQRRGTARTLPNQLTVLFYVLFVSIVLFYILFVCKCVLYYCHRLSTHLQLKKCIISYHIMLVMMTTRSDMMNWKGFGKEMSWTARSTFPSINDDGLRETTTKPRQAYRCFARDTNQVLHKFKSGVLPLQIPTPVLCSWKVSLNNSRKIRFSFAWNSFIYFVVSSSLDNGL
jgi:hypothetical protein